ncbi:MAG TPA: hypothetical protein VGL56_02995 [Fimbriimonadaceae bacterium]|jgi:hypothetical protein
MLFQAFHNKDMASETCRIDGILATEANRAVIFRRGPSKYCQMLIWDLNVDRVVPGQWLHGQVMTRKCDVSPNGRYLILAAADYRRTKRDFENLGGWTAVTRPPYFTAIALWLTGTTYNNGGIWLNNTNLGVNPPATIIKHIFWKEVRPPSKAITITELGVGIVDGEEKIFSMRLKRRGWTTVGKHVMEKPFANGRLRREIEWPHDRWSILDRAGDVVRAWNPGDDHWQWLDVDANDRVIFGEEGCLWAWERIPNGDPTMIADLNPNTFKAIPPPKEALEW